MTTNYSYLSARDKDPYIKAMYNILSVVKKEKKYFTKNPRHLAWLMHQYDEIHSASKYNGTNNMCHNPKYPIQGLMSSMGEESEYSHLVYDAWAACGSDYGELTTYTEAELKLNKTPEDYYITLALEHLEYYQRRNTSHQADCHLFCNIGWGLDWNKDGYIANIAPYGTDETIFYNFQHCAGQIDPKIKKQLPHLKNSFLNKSIKLMIKKRNAKKDEDRSPMLQKMINETKQTFIEFITKKEPKQTANKLNKLSFDELEDLFESTKEKYLSSAEKAARTKEQEKRKKAKEKYEKSAAGKKEKLKESTYSEIQDLGNLMTMPKNAHESYIKCGLKIAARVLTNPHETAINKKQAKKFVKKWDKKIPGHFKALKTNLPELWKDMPFVINK